MKRLIALMCCVPLIACTPKNKKPKTFPLPVKIAEAKSLALINNSFTGVVKSTQSANISFKIAGQITEIKAEEGQEIRQGQLIASIDPTDMKLNLETAKAKYIKSSLQQERYTRLIEQNAISQQEYESINAAYISDKANYKNAQKQLSETNIYAPFTGIIERRYVDKHQQINPTEPIVSLVNPDNIEMTFSLSESLLPLMSAEQKEFEVRFEVYPNKKFKAKITKFVKSSVGDGYPVTVEIDDPAFNPEKYIIKPGFSCTIYVTVDNKEYKDLIAIPITALAEEMGDNQEYVWVYSSSSSSVKKRYVVSQGLYGDSQVIISYGLKAKEEVVTAGVYSLSENQKVKIVK